MASKAKLGNCELTYEMAGSGPSVIFIHGFGLDHRMFEPQIAHFSRTHTVVRYDLRGFGTSSTPTEAEYSHQEDLRDLMEHLNIERASVVGMSLGGRVATGFARMFPERLDRLILADPALSGYEFSGEWNRLFASFGDVAETEGIKAANDAWANALLSNNPEVDCEIKRLIGEYSGWHWVNQNNVRVNDDANHLNEIAAPTLVVLGERDFPDFHAIANKVANDVPNAKLHVIKSCGHMSTMESAEEFNRITSEFLDRSI